MKATNSLRCLAVLFILMSMDVTAGNVDVNDARVKAAQFLNKRPETVFMASPQTMRLVHAEMSDLDARRADYYVFNAEDGGAFVIVAGDDRAADVLAYGPRALDMDDVPCNMQWLLDQYKRQLAFLRGHPDAVTDRTAGRSQVAVSPLVSCTWNQRSPYYNQCPTSGTQHCLTGCIATAMAQVMYYWRFPTEAPALPGYTSDINGVSVDALPGGVFDWDNMLDEYTNSATTQQRDAVAMLMRYCGQACHMGYGTSGSGAYSTDELEGMKTFGYNADAALLDRDDYSAEEWAAMIEEQLVAGCPILYGGVDAAHNAGHAFVVDGCGGGMYHVNFGWSGSGDGYFVLDAFTSQGLKYSSEQQMLYQVYPTGYLYDKHAAVMNPATDIGGISFTASWNDATPEPLVEDYTLYVQPYEPWEHQELLRETFAAINVNLDATTALSSNKVGDYCDNPGWTGSFVYLGAGGCFIVGGAKYVGSLTTPPLSVRDDGVITVRFNARYFGHDNSSVIVTCDGRQYTVELTRTATEYILVFDKVSNGATVTFGCTGRSSRFYLDDVVVTTGDDREPAEMDPEQDNVLVFPGLTARSHTINGLTLGGTYRYQVVTRYTDGTTRKSDVGIVALIVVHAHAMGDANHDGNTNISDVILMINYVQGLPVELCEICADVNGDQKINITDITALINIIGNSSY
jgi:hypothetical protein